MQEPYHIIVDGLLVGSRSSCSRQDASRSSDKKRNFITQDRHDRIYSCRRAVRWANGTTPKRLRGGQIVILSRLPSIDVCSRNAHAVLYGWNEAKRRKRQSRSVDEDDRRLNWYSIRSRTFRAVAEKGSSPFRDVQPSQWSQIREPAWRIDGLTGCGQKPIMIRTHGTCGSCRSGTL